MDETMTGGCLCKKVRYETTGEPFAVNYCHCQTCRKHNGAPMATFAGFRANQVRFLGNDRKTYESSPGAFRAFCENCGTPLTWEGHDDDLGQLIEIHVGTFDDPEAMVPTSHAFEPERVSWFDIADELPRFEGFSDLSPLLHKGPLSSIKSSDE